MEFTKLQAQGNDFVLLDCREGFPDNMERLARALESKNRLDLGVTAPAHGLELTRVEYAFEKKGI